MIQTRKHTDKEERYRIDKETKRQRERQMVLLRGEIKIANERWRLRKTERQTDRQTDRETEGER
jgi:hypothetical protein